jgi:CBS domain-containing protein
MRVSQVMTKDVETISAERSLMLAAEKMRARNIGFLPVLEDESVIGVITDRDITLRGLGEGRAPQLTTVRDAMTPGALCCYADEVLTDAAKLMEENHVRRLLVLDELKHVVGLLSIEDLAAHMSSDRLLGTVLRHVAVS